MFKLRYPLETVLLLPHQQAALLVSGQSSNILTIDGTLAAINQTLASLKYTVPNGDFNVLNNSGNVVVTVDVSDNGNTGTGGTLTDTSNFNITVVPTNDNPVISAPSGSNVNEGPGANLGIATLSIGDVDVNEAGTGTIDVSVSIPSGDGSLAMNAMGGASVTGSGSGTMSISGSLADVNATLATLVYSVPNGNFNSLNNGGDVIVSVSVDDNGNTGLGGGTSIPSSFAIAVNATNDAPVVNLPGAALALNEGVGANLLLAGLSVSDVDADENPTGTVSVQVSIPLNRGSLSATASGGATINGIGSNVLQIAGSLTDVNAILASLRYTVPNGDFNSINNGGDVVVTVGVNDQGNTGLVGA